MPRGIASIREVGSTQEGSPSGGLLERLGCLGELIGASWGSRGIILEASWAPVGASWAPLG
eukprot:8220001-Pyramimonas_sp.AAC.1